jgi:hypothetical protein
MVIQKRAGRQLKGRGQYKPSSLGGRGEGGEWGSGRESWGKERRGKSKGQSRVVWSPVKFVLGVRRTTNGVARSMNINITFLLDGRDVPFLRSFKF